MVFLFTELSFGLFSTGFSCATTLVVVVFLEAALAAGRLRAAALGAAFFSALGAAAGLAALGASFTAASSFAGVSAGCSIEVCSGSFFSSSIT